MEVGSSQTRVLSFGSLARVRVRVRLSRVDGTSPLAGGGGCQADARNAGRVQGQVQVQVTRYRATLTGKMLRLRRLVSGKVGLGRRGREGRGMDEVVVGVRVGNEPGW